MLELLTAQEVATKLKVKINTVYRWINTGKLQAVRAGEKWLVYEADLDAFLRGHKLNGKGG